MNNSKRHSILCPNCRKLISTNEFKCPHCGVVNPGSPMKGFFLKYLNQSEAFINTMIGINIGMYVLSLLLSTRMFAAMYRPLSMLAPDGWILQSLGATGSLVVNWNQGWWTLIAANYLHGSILHILFNMIVFWQICPLVIREYGISRTITIYTLSGITGFAISIFADVSSTIGASAAVCGLMGALVYYGKSRGGIYGQMIYKQIGGWMLALFVFGLLFKGIGIDNWAHGGGLLGGISTGFILGYEERTRENNHHRRFAVVVSLITVVILFRSALLGIIDRF